MNRHRESPDRHRHGTNARRTVIQALAGRSVSRNASLVRDARAAMNRLSGGAYGRCVECEEPIALSRRPVGGTLPLV